MVADSQHTFRFLKQVLSWTKPKLRDPAAADRWTWLILACYAQLWLEAVSPAAAVRHASVGTGAWSTDRGGKTTDGGGGSGHADRPPVVCGVSLPVDAVGVDLQRDGDAVPGAWSK
jgi:hypothetical protein